MTDYPRDELMVLWRKDLKALAEGTHMPPTSHQLRYAALQRAFMVRVFRRLQNLAWTLTEIGEVWSLSRQRVSQIILGV